MAKSGLTALNIAGIVTEAARAFEYSGTALDHLIQISSTAMGAAGAAVFGVRGENDAAFVAGRDSRLRKEKARAALIAWHPSSHVDRPTNGVAVGEDEGAGPAYARVLICDGLPYGVWAVLLPGANDLDAWD